MKPAQSEIDTIYAAPASEAKAQGVVMPERARIRMPCRMYDEPDAESPEFARGHNAALGYVERLNAAPVQQVSVPDGWKQWAVGDTVRYLGSGEQYEDCHAAMTIGSDYLVNESPDEYQSMVVLDDDGDEISVLVGEFQHIAAAPAAPAADAGLVEALKLADWSGVNIGNKALISAAIEALAARRAQGVV